MFNFVPNIDDLMKRIRAIKVHVEHIQKRKLKDESNPRESQRNLQLIKKSLRSGMWRNEVDGFSGR